MLNLQRADPHLLGNLVSRVRGGIIHDDHLVRLRNLVHRRANAAQTFANQTLFIMGWDDEGEHAGLIVNRSTDGQQRAQAEAEAAGLGGWLRFGVHGADSLSCKITVIG